MQQQHIADLNAIQLNDFSQHEAVVRLEILFGRHAQVIEQLRELSGEQPSVQPHGEDDWHDLISRVSNLRSEIENYKQTFSAVAAPSFFVFDSDATLNFLTLET